MYTCLPSPIANYCNRTSPETSSVSLILTKASNIWRRQATINNQQHQHDVGIEQLVDRKQITTNKTNGFPTWATTRTTARKMFTKRTMTISTEKAPLTSYASSRGRLPTLTNGAPSTTTMTMTIIPTTTTTNCENNNQTTATTWRDACT